MTDKILCERLYPKAPIASIIESTSVSGADSEQIQYSFFDG